MDNEREEGEMSDEAESMSVDEELQSSPTQEIHAVDNHAILYQWDKQKGLTVEKLQNSDPVKLENRITFGDHLDDFNVVSQKQIEELYKYIGIDESNKRHIQFDTIHMRGVDELTITDIFKYFKDHEPISVQRINKSSCNVVFKDDTSAAMAILSNSREITEEDKTVTAQKYPPYNWREGLAHRCSELILMRFATHSESFESGCSHKKNNYLRDIEAYHGLEKNPWGDLSKSWGVYDHQEIYGPKLPPKSYIKTEAGIVRKSRANHRDEEDMFVPRILSSNLAKRLGKRQYEVETSSDESDSDDEWKKKSKVPRMRMRADDEEKKLKSMHPVVSKEYDDESYKALSIQIDNTNHEKLTNNSDKTILSDKFSSRSKIYLGNSKADVQSRLGKRVQANSADESSNDSSSYTQMNVMSKIQKAPTKKTLASVWTRLDKTGAQTDLRQTLNKTKSVVTQSDRSDLRAKLKEKRKSPLRIEIDNEYYESD